MKLYNQNIDKTENIKSFVSNGVQYIANKLTEAELNTMSYYYIEFVSPPDRRYYTYTEEKAIIENRYTNVYLPIERPLSDVIERMQTGLRETYIDLGLRPRLDSTLGYDIFGGREDIEDFQMWKEYAETEIVDADGNFQSVTGGSYDTIATVIKDHRRLVFTTGKVKNAEVKAFTSIDECILYEATPYDCPEYDMDGELTGSTVTCYRDNVTDWQL